METLKQQYLSLITKVTDKFTPSILRSFFNAAASFEVNARTIVEGSPSSEICATMKTTPAEATLEKEVEVTLSTEDGTGICYLGVVDKAHTTIGEVQGMLVLL